MKTYHTIKATQQRTKGYINNILQEFAEVYEPAKGASYVEFGKQDMRGVPSITVNDDKHRVTHQRHFATSAELLAFVEGYINAKRGF